MGRQGRDLLKILSEKTQTPSSEENWGRLDKTVEVVIFGFRIFSFALIGFYK